MTVGSTRAARGLECLVGSARRGIPAESVQQIIEYEVMSPVPLARPGFAGLGVFNEKVVVSITLAAPELQATQAGGRRSTKGVLLNVPQSSIDWALEVTGIVGFLDASLLEEAAPTPAPREGVASGSWLGEATTDDGRTIGWIDVNEMLGDFLSSRADDPGPRG